MKQRVKINFITVALFCVIYILLQGMKSELGG